MPSTADVAEASVSTDVRVVLVTAPDASEGERICRAVVEERLAACGSVVPGVVSIFRWEGRVDRADEVLLVLKTTAGRFDALRGRVVELHPYDVPEVLSLPVDAGHEAYLTWVGAEAGGGA